MANLTKCNSWIDADRILGNRDRKKIGHNTWLQRAGSDIQAIYHITPVVTYSPDGVITANSGGWQTMTTKDRLNQLLPTSIWQAKNIWTVSSGERFFDGIQFDHSGKVLNPLPTADTEALDKENRKIKKQIKTFIDGYCNELTGKGLPMPSSGDCFYCQMALEPENDYSDHLISHMEEPYYVPSLAINALRESGYKDAGIYFFLGMNPEGNIMGKDRRVDTTLVKRALRKYMQKRLLKKV